MKNGAKDGLVAMIGYKVKGHSYLMLSLSVYSSLDCSAPPWKTLITADWTLARHTTHAQVKGQCAIECCYRFVSEDGEFSLYSWASRHLVSQSVSQSVDR